YGRAPHATVKRASQGTRKDLEIGIGEKRERDLAERRAGARERLISRAESDRCRERDRKPVDARADRGRRNRDTGMLRRQRKRAPVGGCEQGGLVVTSVAPSRTNRMDDV